MPSVMFPVLSGLTGAAVRPAWVVWPWPMACRGCSLSGRSSSGEAIVVTFALWLVVAAAVLRGRFAVAGMCPGR